MLLENYLPALIPHTQALLSLKTLTTAGLFWSRSNPSPAPDAEHQKSLPQAQELARNLDGEEDMSQPFQHPELTPQFCFNERVLRGNTLW